MLAILLHGFENADSENPFNCTEDDLIKLIDYLDLSKYINPGFALSNLNNDGWFITVDDGNSSDLRLATFLNNLRIKAIFFINPVNIGMPGYLKEDELFQIRDMGHFVENHGFRHKNMVKISLKNAKDEILSSKKWLENRNLGNLKVFAYPWGRSNFLVRQLIKTAGYKHAFGVTPRKISQDSPGLLLPRFTLIRNTDLISLKKCIIRSPFSRFESRLREPKRILDSLL